MYSTQPEESTTTRSEALGVITVFVLPLHALGDAAKFLDGAGALEADGAVQDVDLEFLAGLQLQGLSNRFGNDNLKLGRNFDRIHSKLQSLVYRLQNRMSIYLSINQTSYASMTTRVASASAHFGDLGDSWREVLFLWARGFELLPSGGKLQWPGNSGKKNEAGWGPGPTPPSVAVTVSR